MFSLIFLALSAFLASLAHSKQYLYLSNEYAELMHIPDDFHFTADSVSHLIRELLGLPGFVQYSDKIYRNDYFRVAKDLTIGSYRSRIYKEPAAYTDGTYRKFNHLKEVYYKRYEVMDNISEIADEWTFNKDIGYHVKVLNEDMMVEYKGDFKTHKIAALLVPSTYAYSTAFTQSFWIVVMIIIVVTVASIYSCSEPEKDDELAALLFDAPDMQIEPENVVEGEKWEDGDGE